MKKDLTRYPTTYMTPKLCTKYEIERSISISISISESDQR